MVDTRGGDGSRGRHRFSIDEVEGAVVMARCYRLAIGRPGKGRDRGRLLE